MPDTTTSEVTNIQQVEVDNLNDILGIPGADSIILPEGNTTQNIFSKNKTVDLKFVDKPDVTKEETTKTQVKPEDTTKTVVPEAKPTDTTPISEIISEVEDTTKEDKEKDEVTSGRPKVTKDGAIELTKKLIEKGLIVPFDDEKNIEDYTLKDFEELFEANVTDKEAKIRQDTPLEFFESLPEELQVAAKYHADGGTDMKGLFQILSQVEETRDLDPKKEEDQTVIVREYLRAINFGTSEEIDEEIDSLKDMNKISQQAEKFKPKLDKMSESRVAQKLAHQENLRKQQADASSKYVNNIYETLKPAELNGLKLDKKTQGMLYSGLIQPNYPSLSGKPTNLLGHLLEKYQYVEPNHALIAEALWLLSDPDGYKSKVKDLGKNAQVEDTVRKLKTEESRKLSSSPIIEKDEQKQRTVKRNDSFFKR